MTPIPDSIEERREYLQELLAEVEKAKLKIYYDFSVDETKVVINRSDWFLIDKHEDNAPELFDIEDTNAYRHAVNYLFAKLYHDII